MIMYIKEYRILTIIRYTVEIVLFVLKYPWKLYINFRLVYHVRNIINIRNS